MAVEARTLAARPVSRMGLAWTVLGGLGAVVILAIVIWAGDAGAWRSWLAAASLTAGAGTGAIVLLMMLRLIPGAWRDSLTAPLLGLAAVIVVGALAMLPVLAATHRLYPWAIHPPQNFRHIFLNPAAFAIRTLIWLALLVGLAWRARTRRTPALAVTSLIAIVLFGTVITADWLMSLSADFASSGFGLYILALWINLALSLGLAASGEADEKHRAIAASVLLTSTILWAYLGFMQYFIAWSGDLPSSAGWFLSRGHRWTAVAGLAILLRGGSNLLLIAHTVRHDRDLVTRIALASAVAAPIEMAWIVLPPAHPDTLALTLYVAACIALTAAGHGVWRLAWPGARP